jgi:hypothetical protein
MDISDDASNAPTLITASSPNKNPVKWRETWPSPPSTTLSFLPLHPLTISFAKPFDGAHEHFSPMTTGVIPPSGIPPLGIPPAGIPFTSRFVGPTPSDWFLQRLQKRLRPEDIPCIPNTQRQYQKRYRKSNGNHREAHRSLCLFLNYFDRTLSTPRRSTTITAAAKKKKKLPPAIPKVIVSPKSSFSVEDTSSTMQLSSPCFGIMDDDDPYRPSWNDIVSQTIQEDDDSDCFSISSIDATFEMHHYAEDVVVSSAIHNPSSLMPVFRGNGTKVKHACNTTGREKRSAPVLPPLVENDSPGLDSKK